jgi:hypothetical protein
LEANRQQRLIREREHRRTTSHAQILSFLNNIKENECPYIELESGSGTEINTTEKVRLPFPSIETIRKLSFLAILWDKDITAEDTLSSLTSWRPELDQAILWWRRHLEQELVKMLSENKWDAHPIMPVRKRLRSKGKWSWKSEYILLAWCRR